MWLAGLLLLPVIRWLHRGGRHRRAVPVARLALWRGAAASPPAAGERRPPDPAWRRRALLAALLCIALAGPQLPPSRVHVTLWVDDSLSMLTREADGLRLAQGVAQARALLAELVPADVEVRALGDPWHSLGPLGDGAVAALLASAGRTEPSAPPAALLRRDSQHWLVTDGADASLLQWPEGTRPDRIVQVAGVTRNVGLVRLSGRRHLEDPDQVDLLLEVRNGGDAAETREVRLFAAAAQAAMSTYRIEPGASVRVAASMPAAGRIRATLQPGDALAEDDEIVLDLAPLRRRRVAVDPSCPQALRVAVGAHPALALVQPNATDAEALLDCATPGAARGLATIRVQADRTPARPRGALLWSSSVAESGRIVLDTERLQVVAQLRPGAGDAVLLAVGDEPLIVRRAGAPAQLETSLDFESLGRTAGPELPLLVNWLFQRLLGEDLLDGIAIADRGRASVLVAPAASVGADAPARAQGEAGVMSDWTRPLLVAALLVLLWEIVALGRQWARWAGRSEAGAE